MPTPPSMLPSARAAIACASTRSRTWTARLANSATSRDSAPMPPKKTSTKKATKTRVTKKKQPARKRTGMTRAHKQALARGRDDSRAVSCYLEALEAERPRPGRQRTTQSMQNRLKQAESLLRQPLGLDRLCLPHGRQALTVAIP